MIAAHAQRRLSDKLEVMIRACRTAFRTADADRRNAAHHGTPS
jgi:hypothetical protein